MIGNVLFGRLSDRTTARWGRRRPWIVAGTIAMTGAFSIIALGQSVPVVTVGWCLAQLGANATLAPFVATISDQVPKFQRGSVSALLGIAQNVGVLGGVYLAQLFAKQMVILFVVPSIFAIGAMLLFAFDPARPASEGQAAADDGRRVDRHPVGQPSQVPRLRLRLVVPVPDHPGQFHVHHVPAVLHAGPAGNIPRRRAGQGVRRRPDLHHRSGCVRLGRGEDLRPHRVGGSSSWRGSTLLFAVGTVLLAHVSTLTGFYVVEALLGVAFGIYVGVDLALVVDVLPNPDDAGKDLGVFNMANALPQSASAGARGCAARRQQRQQPELRPAALLRRRRGADRGPGRAADQEGQVTAMLDIDRLLAELTVEEKASLTSGSSLLVHRTGGAARHPAGSWFPTARTACGPSPG